MIASIRGDVRPSPSEAVRHKLDHPVIDGDGHCLEIEPIVLDYLKQVGGPTLAARYLELIQGKNSPGWYKLSWEERRARRVQRPSYWLIPAANTLDRATAMLPALMRSRMDELGLDFAVVYPTIANLFAELTDPELRSAICRAMNLMHADLFRGHADRLTPVAVIPMHTPGEAVAEMTFAVKELGYKVVVLQGNVRRPISDKDRVGAPLTRGGAGYWIDSFGLDSAYDYDSVWRACVDLKVAATCHSGSQGWAHRTAPSSFVFNHMGHFANHHETLCKALFLGGVTQRFPSLNVAFLEGGVGWAALLYNQIFEHWEKRNVDALLANLDPATVDRALFTELYAAYAEPDHRAKVTALAEGDGHYWNQWNEKREDLDEWKLAGVRSPQDIHERFVPRFYFGCEADDRSIPWAFNSRLNRLGGRLKAIFSSDIGHYDVTDARRCVAEAHELVDEGHLTPDDFRDFMFTNAVTLHTGMNRDFFRGTVIEDAAAKVIAEQG